MPDQELRELAEEYWDVLMEASPTSATLLGDHRFDDRLEDLSSEGQARERRRLTSIEERLVSIDRARLVGDDLVTHAQLVSELGDAVSAIDHRLVELESDQMTGFHVGLLQTVPVMSAPDPAAAQMLLGRFRQVPRALDQLAQRFFEGADAGRTPVAICVSRAVNMIEGYLASPLAEDVFVRLTGPAGWEGEHDWRSSLEAVARDVVRPAYRRLADTLTEQLLPLSRDDEHCGLSWLAEGPELYAVLVAHHTTVDRAPPEEVHRIGLEEVTQKLPAEFADVGGRLFGINDAGEVLERLRQDQALRYVTGDEIMDDARQAFEAATAAMADWFGRLPQAPCAIEAVPAFLAPDSPSAYYFPPAADGSRGGTYYVNTDRPEQKARYETASIAFHEAIPGHHLQLAIATELTGLPRFRRFSLGNTAYVEGWGLYAERLADEMGLYRSDLERIGMLAADSIRACRLVVDTGLHHLGWSRARAIDFMATHTPVSVEEVTVEIDRYIGMPGQALAYKLGQREIFRLREAARTRLDGRFDIKGFHDAVLGSGAVRLPVLGELVEGWAASRAT
ncbi:MAG TPA: DUF885 domain-containing protein [Acidimicrobiales bacterium]|nr:DUF885 domain-containing protein [Acidimicrobiales bacterium]